MKRQQGFTLIEIVVVVVIISLVITMTTISIGNPQEKRLKQSSNRVAVLLQLAQEQAIFNSQDYALSVWESGYAFYAYTLVDEKKNEWEWLAVDNDRMFRSRKLPDGLEFFLYLDGVKVSLERDDKKKPQIFITSDGEFSPFELEITDHHDWLYEISYNEKGEFEITAAGA